jgi:hypothetical protein
MDPFERGMMMRGSHPSQQANAIADDRNALAWKQLAEQQDERVKRETAGGKAAEYFIKANPEALTKLGYTDQQFANMSASEQSGLVMGFVQDQATKQAMQKLAQEQQTMAADQAFGQDINRVFGRNALQTLARGDGPVPPPALNGQQLAAGISAQGWQSKRADPLLNYHMLTTEGGKNAAQIAFEEDPVSGQRFATYGNQMQSSGANPNRVSAQGAPTISPDGQFFHNGRQWVAVKQLGYPEGSRIVTENGQTVVLGPDNRILTPPRGANPFAASFGAGGASPAAPAGSAPESGNSGKPITDKAGKSWLYLGNSDDPTQDRDPKNWRAQ